MHSRSLCHPPEVGPPKWRSNDLEFMQALARSCRPDGSFALDDKIGFYDQGLDPYGQDDGEASWRIPLGRVNWAFPLQVRCTTGR